jgi:membrane protease YdiL (CAAX protease family)
MLVVAMKKYKKRIRFSYFAGMLFESLIYAFFIGIISSKIAVVVTSGNPFLSTSASDTVEVGNSVMYQLMIGVGAGVYEEIVFRGLLITFLLIIIQQISWLRDHKMVIAIFLSGI